MGQATPTDRLYAIVEQGLCIGCGICEAVAGADTVRCTVTPSGYEQPVVIGDLDHATVDRIYDTCPGTRVGGLPPQLVDSDAQLDPVWGVFKRMVRAWAGDPMVRHKAATAGVLTALAGYLLDTGRVEFILHAKASTKRPTFGERHLSFSQTDVLTATGSRYGPTALLIDIDDVLDRGAPFAFIGKPCDIGALRNHARHDPRVNELVRYWLTPVCGGYMPPASMDAFLTRLQVNPEDVTAFRYRGHGCPGPTRIETGTAVREAHYLDFWGDDATMWQLPWRCKICPDGIGESADIAAADSWPGGSPTREGSEHDPGTNAVIVRTGLGLELLESAVRDGALVIERDIGPEDLTSYQPHQVRKKQAVWSRYQGLADENRIVPHTDNLRLEQLSVALPAEIQQSQREGTRTRITQGKATEPRPQPALQE